MVKNFFFAGTTDLIITTILSKGDSYAYEIYQKIKGIAGSDYQITQNNIYAAIYKLEKNGYVTEYPVQVTARRTRVYYKLEESGKAYCKELLEKYLQAEKCVNKILEEI